MYNAFTQLISESPFSSRTDIFPWFVCFFFFPFLVSPSAVSGFLPFHRKTCQKDQTSGLRKVTKENWKQRSLIPSDYDQRLKIYCGNPGSFTCFLLLLSWLQRHRFSLLLQFVLTLSASSLTHLHTYIYPVAFWQKDQSRSCFYIFLRFSINYTHKQTLNHIDVFNTSVSTHNDIHRIVVRVGDPYNSQLNWNPTKIW